MWGWSTSSSLSGGETPPRQPAGTSAFRRCAFFAASAARKTPKASRTVAGGRARSARPPDPRVRVSSTAAAVAERFTARGIDPRLLPESENDVLEFPVVARFARTTGYRSKRLRRFQSRDAQTGVL